MYDEFKRDKDGDFRGIFYAVFKRDEDEVFFMLNLNVINMAIFDKDCDFRRIFMMDLNEINMAILGFFGMIEKYEICLFMARIMHKNNVKKCVIRKSSILKIVMHYKETFSELLKQMRLTCMWRGL